MTPMIELNIPGRGTILKLLEHPLRLVATLRQ
jgi:hypothetical protein